MTVKANILSRVMTSVVSVISSLERQQRWEEYTSLGFRECVMKETKIN